MNGSHRSDDCKIYHCSQISKQHPSSAIRGHIYTYTQIILDVCGVKQRLNDFVRLRSLMIYYTFMEILLHVAVLINITILHILLGKTAYQQQLFTLADSMLRLKYQVRIFTGKKLFLCVYILHILPQNYISISNENKDFYSISTVYIYIHYLQ